MNEDAQEAWLILRGARLWLRERGAKPAQCMWSRFGDARRNECFERTKWLCKYHELCTKHAVQYVRKYSPHTHPAYTR